jgi:N-acetylneuraminate synthase/N,N'-diacetyllegionaminate synthase
MKSAVAVGSRTVGAGHPVLVIAEAGVNHNGDPDLAKQLVEAAAAAGADAVKFQAVSAARVASAVAAKVGYQRATADPSESQVQMLRRLELPSDAYGMLARRCAEQGLLFLCSPFDAQSVDALEATGVPAFKVGSGELTNHPFLAHIARKGRPVLLSTGMSTLPEVREAAAVVTAGGAELVLLHCVSTYPARVADANLRAIPTMAQELDVPVGWSDHTLNDEVAVAAVAIGACVVEKHLTLDRSMEGPDHAASLEPVDFTRLVRAIRHVEAAVGDGVKRPVPDEEENRRLVRRSLVVTEDLPAGEMLTECVVDALRPGTGIPPSRRHEVVGRRARRDLGAGELLGWDALE